MTPLPRAVRLLGWVSLLTDAATEAVYPLLPVFITRVLGGPPVAIGIIEGAADATSSLLKVVVGRWSDRLDRRKPIVVAGYALSSLVRPFVAVATTWAHVFGIRLTDRVGKGLRTAPRDAMLAAAAPPGERGRVFGYHWAMDHAGAAVGPLLATAWLWYSPDDYRTLFGLTIVPGLLAVATLLAVPGDHAPGAAVAPARVAPAAPGAPVAPALKHYFFILTLFTLGNSSDAFLLLRLSSAGVPLMGLTLLWSAQHAVKAAISMQASALSDRLGRRRIIIAGWLVYAVVYAGFAWSASRTGLIAWFVLYAAYAAATEGTEKALVTDLSTEGQRGTAFGWYAAIQGIGMLAASLLFGALYQTLGAAAAFLTGAALALAAAAFLSIAKLGAAPGRA
jgi:MFS family permease